MTNVPGVRARRRATRQAEILGRLATGPALLCDLASLPSWEGLTDGSRKMALGSELELMVFRGQIARERTDTGGRPWVYRLANLIEVKEDRPVEPVATAPPYAPTETWTLVEVLTWLAMSQEKPEGAEMGRVFETNRSRAVAALRAAIDGDQCKCHAFTTAAR